MRKFSRFVLLVFAFLFALSSCGGKEKSTSEMLEAVLSEIEKLPEGSFIREGSVEGSDEYLSEDLCTTLYGERAVSDVFPLIEDFAIYLCSFEYPFEVAIFKCYSRSDTDSVAEMCFLRGDVVKVLLHSEGINDVSLRVARKGRYVFMYIGREPQEAVRAFGYAMR
jgi:hypothetical protein